MADIYPGLGEAESEPFGGPPANAAATRDTVLIVSAARVTSIVMARIVATAGLKSLSTDPTEFEQASRQPRLVAIILDEEVQLASRIGDRAILGPEGRPSQRPFVILLASAGSILEAGRSSPHCDAVLAKPIVSETLHPYLFDIRQRLALGGGA